MGVFSFLSDLTGKKKGDAPSPEAIARAEWEGLPPNPQSSIPNPQSSILNPQSPILNPQSPTPNPDPPVFVPPPAWQAAAPTPAPAPEPASGKLEVGALDPDQTAALQSRIIEAIKTVYDPEIPVDIYELGLIYDIVVDANRNVLVNMTLTSPACPSAQQLPVEVRHKVKSLPEVNDVRVEVVWEPAWGKERMSEAAKLALGFF